MICDLNLAAIIGHQQFIRDKTTHWSGLTFSQIPITVSLLKPFNLHQAEEQSTNNNEHCLELVHYNRLQFLMYKEFANGPFAYLQNLTRHYAKHYSRILVFTGAVYDWDMNGIADDESVFW